MSGTSFARFLAAASLALVALLVSPSAQATVLAKDLFLTGGNPGLGQYTNGVKVLGQGPTALGFTGVWITPSSSGVTISNGSLPYVDAHYVAPAGGSTRATADSRVGRLFDATNPFNTPGTFYLSCLMSATGIPVNNYYMAIDFYGPDTGGFNDGTRAFQLGLSGYGDFNNSGIFAFRVNGNGSLVGNLGPTNNLVHLFVAKFTKSAVANSDSVTVWNNPDLSGLPADPPGGVTISGFTLRPIDKLAPARFTAGQVNFDEFRLGTTLMDVVTNPVITLPAATNTAASGITVTGANLNGQVTSAGGETPKVWIYYGTTDGGTTAGSWAANVFAGPSLGAFTAAISNLIPGTLYYSRASVSNSTGAAWAPASTNFTTLPASLATLTNIPAANILGTSATLAGQVLTTGNQTPVITLFYGSTDGGTTAGAWAHSVNLGLQAGGYSTGVTALTPNTTYYFRGSASNAAGVAWAPSTASFNTLVVNQPVVTNSAALNVQATSALLPGQIVSIGNEVPAVTIYYGTTDGGGNPAAWGSSLSLGAQSGGFAALATSLATNKLYYFTAMASNSAGAVWASPSQSFTTLGAVALQPILTYHFDNTRQGQNTNETQLTPANVNTNTFGKLFTYPVDGYVYAQALVATNVSIPGQGVHNILYVVTTHDTVYAFDADTYVPTPYWTNSLLTSLTPGSTVIPAPSADTTISPGTETGITGTPVIDPATATIYVEARTKEVVTGTSTNFLHWLHALDLATGQEKVAYNSPVTIYGTNYTGTGTSGQNDTDGMGHVLWSGLREHSRPALTLANGQVYVCYASPGDHDPWYGWVFSYDAHTLAQTGEFNVAPNNGRGGIWMSGNGPVADTNGYLYMTTGNGHYNTASQAYGDSIIKLNGTNHLALADYFTTYNANTVLEPGDWDVSSAGMLQLPDSLGTVSHPHLLLSGSKYGAIFLLDRDNLGQFNATAGNPNTVQTAEASVSVLWSSPAYFNNTFFMVPCGGQFSGSDTIKSFSLANGQFNPTPTAQGTHGFAYPGATPMVTANGTNDAIVWAVESSGYSSGAQAVLHAFPATNVAVELYNSSQLPSRDNPGPAVLYILPTAANGKVYVGGRFTMSVFGNNVFLALPTISPNGGVFSGSVQVTLADATPGVELHYTLDGSVPGNNSALYSAPFTISNSCAVSVVAIKAGSANSAVVSASFINSSAVGTGTGLTGSYWSNQVALTAFTGPPTLVRTDAVVNFNWGNGSPDPTISTDYFTVRWTGSVQPQFNETYTFYATTDDGVRVWVNGQEIINQWVTQSPTTSQGSIALKSQQFYTIVMEYFENTGGASAQLAWSSPSTVQAVIPQTQLYPYTNPPPGVVLNTPTNGAAYTASASVSLNATAMGQSNAVDNVAFYAGGAYLGSVSNNPYSLTVTGLAAGSYSLTAVATDTTGLSSTSSPLAVITVNPGSGQPYGIASRATVPAFFNMPQSFAGTLPPLLSLAGVFSDTPNMIPVSGLIPYVPNVPLWSDNAVKTRWLGVPYAGGSLTADQQIGFATNGEWSFPNGTVFVKHFGLVVNETNNLIPARRLETRLLVRDTNGAVYGVTYKWHPDNSEADLLTTNLSENILITNATGVRTQTWYYPSPADCLLCHRQSANYVLGLKTRQLNGNFTYPASGVTDNQLRAFNHLGLFNPAPDDAQIPAYAQMQALTNLSATLEDRSRSYIDANCAMCHRPGGINHANFDARYDMPIGSQNLINGPVVSTLGYDNAAVVVPQDIWRSILYERMHTTDPAIQMQPLARNLVDTNAVAVITAWINSLSAAQPALAPPTLMPSGGTFYGPAHVTIVPPDQNATVYYTLDGSLPTTGSYVYSGPVAVSNTATLNANAFEANYNNSVAANALFTILPPIFFSSPASIVSGTFQVQLSGSANATYILQASSDLVSWTSISTNTPSVTPFTLTDPNANSYPHRYYRVLLQQP